MVATTATAPPGPGFSLTLLGTPLVRRIAADGGQSEVTWRLRRALQTVAFLALAPDHRAAKGALIEAVWPEASVETIARNFHPTLSDARRALAGRGPGRPEVIVLRQGIYALSSQFAWQVDVGRFQELIASGRKQFRQAAASGSEDQATAALDDWTAAWHLYRGPLLVGFEAPWVAARREELQRVYVDLLVNVGRLSARLDQLTQALDAYRTVLIEEPYQEHVHMAVMELYARVGRRDLVRKQYVRLQELLAELEVEPGSEIRQCYHRLMQ